MLLRSTVRHARGQTFCGRSALRLRLRLLRSLRLRFSTSEPRLGLRRPDLRPRSVGELRRWGLSSLDRIVTEHSR